MMGGVFPFVQFLRRNVEWGFYFRSFLFLWQDYGMRGIFKFFSFFGRTVRWGRVSVFLLLWKDYRMRRDILRFQFLVSTAG